MARKRMIDPEFWSDEEIGNWSRSARLFYIALWNFSDDCGRFKAHSGLLKSQIFPYDDPKSLKIEKLKEEVSNKIVWYEINGSQYGYLRNFLKHQRIDRPQPSKLPPPPQDKIADNSSNNRRVVPPNIKEVNIIEYNIKEVNISEEEVKNLRNIFSPSSPKNKRGLSNHLKNRGCSEKQTEEIILRVYEKT